MWTSYWGQGWTNVRRIVLIVVSRYCSHVGYSGIVYFGFEWSCALSRPWVLKASGVLIAREPRLESTNISTSC
jgi:hypothetical protein